MGKLSGMLKQAASQVEYTGGIGWGPYIDPWSRPGFGELMGSTLGGQLAFMGANRLFGRVPGANWLTNPVIGGLSTYFNRTGKIPFTNLKLFRGEVDRLASDAYSQGYDAGWASPLAARFARRRLNG